jgi:hypothetical protein
MEAGKVVQAKLGDTIEIDVSVGNPVILKRTIQISVSNLIEMLELQVSAAVRKPVSRKSKTPEALLSRRVNYYLTAWIRGKWSNGAKVDGDLEEHIRTLIRDVDVSKLGDKTYRKLVEFNFIGG